MYTFSLCRFLSSNFLIAIKVRNLLFSHNSNQHAPAHKFGQVCNLSSCQTPNPVAKEFDFTRLTVASHRILRAICLVYICGRHVSFFILIFFVGFVLSWIRNVYGEYVVISFHILNLTWIPFWFSYIFVSYMNTCMKQFPFQELSTNVSYLFVNTLFEVLLF